MNRGILAARTDTAIARIAAETARLGGLLVVPDGRVPDNDHRNLFLLEAIAEALTAIRQQELAPAEPETVEPETVQPEVAPARNPARGRTKK